MEVEFKRTGERRYAVIVRAAGRAPRVMDPAPGFDALLPHDLLHYVVEAELGLERGIFGQLAAGGDARTFRGTDAASAIGGNARRMQARARRRAAHRGERLARAGRDESARSERATYLSMHAWLAGAGNTALRRRAQRMSAGAREQRDSMAPTEAAALDAAMPRIRARLDVLTTQWSALAIGGSLRVVWPDQRHPAPLS